VRDALFGGTVTLYQPARGYRVNVDTLLLADFAAIARPRALRVVDLGSGVGALTLAYGHFAHVEHADLVERESNLVALARRNLGEAGIAATAHVADLARDGLPRALRGAADVVLSNPPFFAERTTRASADAARRRARTGPLAPFVRAAADAIGRRASVFFVYPAPALAEVFAVARDASLVVKRLRLVHAFAESPARLALLELKRAKPGGLAVMPPLVEWAEKGVRTPELAAIVAGARAEP
jgi:tRNA1(Val) A37 N6-methylase TrmN6